MSKFKIGDRVRVVGDNSSMYDVGHVGEVLSENGGTYDIGPETKGPTCIWGGSLELVTPSTNYNDGKWHGWNGGECPVHPESVVDVMFLDGDKYYECSAENWKWDEFGAGSIVAFRVVKEHKEAREFWVDPNGVKIMFPYHDTDDNDIFYERGYIHVREVIE